VEPTEVVMSQESSSVRTRARLRRFADSFLTAEPAEPAEPAETTVVDTFSADSRQQP
jgi:hypothetical protein